MFKNILIVGGGRGLGRAVALFTGTHLGGLESVTLVGRKKSFLESAAQELFVDDEKMGRRAVGSATHVNLHSIDMSLAHDQEFLGQLIEKEKFDLVVYAAGGGPHGEFSGKAWKDHRWSLEVGLVAPMALVWSWLRCRETTLPGKFVVVGSRIAEQNPDPLASSYAAGKHGLIGFVSSLQPELERNHNRVWLFSPGYMDSEMLPLTAKVRHDGSKLMSVETAAQALLRWVKKNEGPWHRVLN